MQTKKTSFPCNKYIIGRINIVVKKYNIYYLLDYFHKKKRFNLVFSETAISVNVTIKIKNARYEKLSPNL